MKHNFSRRATLSMRFTITALAVAFLGPCGFAAMLFNPFISSHLGVSFPVPNAEGKSDIIGMASLAQEIKWEQNLIQAAVQSSPFADGMSGKIGSGKIKEYKNATGTVKGQQIVISTYETLGAPGIFGANEQVGNEEFVVFGDFTLTWDFWQTAVAIKNQAKAQTIQGAEWDTYTANLLTDRWEKKMSDDDMMCLIGAAASANTLFPNGKTIDTLSTSDTYSYALAVRTGSQLKDIGALPSMIAKSDSGAPIKKYIMFGTDAGMRPIKDDSSYLLAMREAKERGAKNNLFTGEYSDIDGHILYPWQNIIHGAYGSVGSALQAEAKLGTAIVAKATTSSIPGGATTSTAGGLDGGGSNAAAAALPARNFFEFFSLFAYLQTSGLTVTQTPRATYGYIAVKDAVTGLISLFSYTGNTGHQLTGLTRLGSTIAGDYNTTLPGSTITWNVTPWTAAADTFGYLGLSEGIISVGSSIYEVNSKGVPIAKAFGLGERALVAGFGRISLPTGGFKSSAARTDYMAPYGTSFGRGIRVAYGSAAYLRPDGLAPNFVYSQFSRAIDGFPTIA